MFGPTGPPQKAPQATEHRTAVRNFLACESIFIACCNILAVQHDNLSPINIIRLLNSESRISNQVIANSSDTAYGCNAEFMVGFCSLMSENVCEAPQFYRTASNPIISTCFSGKTM